MAHFEPPSPFEWRSKKHKTHKDVAAKPANKKAKLDALQTKQLCFVISFADEQQWEVGSVRSGPRRRRGWMKRALDELVSVFLES